METQETIINRVAQSGLITLNLENYFPQMPIATFDIKDFLFMGLILKEKEFRAALKEHDWMQYKQKNVAILCSADAIVPYWAYMLIAGYLEPVAAAFICGSNDALLSHLYLKNLAAINLDEFRDKRVVVKGCGDKPVPPAAYTEITRLLKPIVKSLMYGEPCSTVPILKN